MLPIIAIPIAIITIGIIIFAPLKFSTFDMEALGDVFYNFPEWGDQLIPDILMAVNGFPLVNWSESNYRPIDGRLNQNTTPKTKWNALILEETSRIDFYRTQIVKYMWRLRDKGDPLKDGKKA